MHYRQQINIAKIISEYLKKEGRSVAWLCRELHWDRKKWYRFQESDYIDVYDLLKISLLLNKDFFSDFSSFFTENLQK